MSKEDQLFDRVMGKRPLKDISNNADLKQRRREKDSKRRKLLEQRSLIKRRLNYQKYFRNKRYRETDEQCEARLNDHRMRAQDRYARETDEVHQTRLSDLRKRAERKTC